MTDREVRLLLDVQDDCAGLGFKFGIEINKDGSNLFYLTNEKGVSVCRSTNIGILYGFLMGVNYGRA